MKQFENVVYKVACGVILAAVVWMLGGLDRCYYGGLVAVGFVLCLRSRMGEKILFGIRRGTAEHPWLSFAGTIVVAMVVRVLAGVVCNWYFSNDPATLVSDFGLLHREAMQIASGHWVHSKSWMTVLLYGGVYKLFGTSVRVAFIASLVFQVITAFCGFVLLKRWFNALAGVVFSLLFLCAPLVVFHAQNIATEHVYLMFVMLALLTMFSLLDREYDGLRACVGVGVLGVVLGLLIWAAIWTRGEGLLLWVVCPGWIFMSALFAKDWRRMLVLPVLAIVFVVGATLAMNFNERQIGNRIFTCNNTKYWNMLYGANFWTQGRWNVNDHVLMWERYLADHLDCDWELKPTDPALGFVEVSPKCFGGGAPTAVVPYMVAEVKLRWQEMSWRRKIKHVLNKWQVWRQEWCPNYACRNYWHITCLSFCSAVYIGFMCWVSVWLLAERIKWQDSTGAWGVLVFGALIVGHMAMSVIAEVQPRYSQILHISLAVIASGCVGTYGLKDRNLR